MSHTIVFVHGLLGFSELRLLGLRIDYFRGLREALEEEGVSVYFPALPTAGSVINRAYALATLLQAQAVDTFTIVAHSMGGLDARYLIRHLDPRRRVRGLITIGAPHRGSPVARWALETNGILQGIARHYGRDALTDLTPDACHKNNLALQDRADVRYVSYSGHRTLVKQPWWLRRFGKIIDAESGANDGLVSLESARWGEFRGVLRADHLELVGWSLARPDPKNSRPFPHLDFYRRVAYEALELDSEALARYSEPADAAF